MAVRDARSRHALRARLDLPADPLAALRKVVTLPPNARFERATGIPVPAPVPASASTAASTAAHTAPVNTTAPTAPSPAPPSLGLPGFSEGALADVTHEYSGGGSGGGASPSSFGAAWASAHDQLRAYVKGLRPTLLDADGEVVSEADDDDAPDR
jgi:hypothetical protein